MKTRFSLIPLCLILQLLFAFSAAAEAAIVISPMKNESIGEAQLPLREPPAMPMAAGTTENAGAQTEGGSVFYNRQLIQATLGKTRQVLLTFDDGPHPNGTPQILDTLKRHNLKAVFFVVGMNVRKYPGLLQRIHAEGHTIGNHTFYHPNLAHLRPGRILKEIRETNELVRQITGVKPTLFRPPYGAVNAQVLQILRQEHMDVMLWTFDPGDWRNRNMARTIENLKRQMKFSEGGRGGVVLFHDTLPSTAHALEPFLVAMKSHGLLGTAFAGRPVVYDRSFWGTRSMSVFAWHELAPILYLEQLKRPVLQNLIGTDKQAELSPIALLRAQKTGSIRQYLLCTLGCSGKQSF